MVRESEKITRVREFKRQWMRENKKKQSQNDQKRTERRVCGEKLIHNTGKINSQHQ
jgi:hypothetical protein